MSIIEKAAGRISEGKTSEGKTSESQASGSSPGAAPAPDAMTRNTDGPKLHSKHSSAVPYPEKRTPKRVDINLARLNQMGFVTPEGGRILVAEDFRIIKRPLIKNAFDQNGKVVNNSNLIMVTSALPKEGKTFCSINLAMSIAMEMDHTVLLVDADVARPSILNALGLDTEPGLMDLLLDEKLDLADVMLKTNVDTLSILPAGRSHKHATELLASQTMSNLLSEISKRYPDRVVIFDSPPLLLTTEAHVLASKMGQIVLVVEAETTTQHAVKESVRQLEGCPNVNLIYNKTRDFAGLDNYGYYYN